MRAFPKSCKSFPRFDDFLCVYQNPGRATEIKLVCYKKLGQNGSHIDMYIYETPPCAV